MCRDSGAMAQGSVFEPSGSRLGQHVKVQDITPFDNEMIQGVGMTPQWCKIKWQNGK